MIIIRLESIILPYKKQPRKYDCDTQCMICRELPNETVICPGTGRLRKSTNLLIEEVEQMSVLSALLYFPFLLKKKLPHEITKCKYMLQIDNYNFKANLRK